MGVRGVLRGCQAGVGGCYRVSLVKEEVLECVSEVPEKVREASTWVRKVQGEGEGKGVTRASVE